MKKIEKIGALKILDSRGDWTLEVRITLEGGFSASASVPSGKSVGSLKLKRCRRNRLSTLLNQLLKIS